MSDVDVRLLHIASQDQEERLPLLDPETAAEFAVLEQGVRDAETALKDAYAKALALWTRLDVAANSHYELKALRAALCDGRTFVSAVGPSALQDDPPSSTYRVREVHLPCVAVECTTYFRKARVDLDFDKFAAFCTGKDSHVAHMLSRKSERIIALSGQLTCQYLDRDCHLFNKDHEGSAEMVFCEGGCTVFVYGEDMDEDDEDGDEDEDGEVGEDGEEGDEDRKEDGDGDVDGDEGEASGVAPGK
jgi:hypothetical protein